MTRPPCLRRAEGSPKRRQTWSSSVSLPGAEALRSESLTSVVSSVIARGRYFEPSVLIASSTDEPVSRIRADMFSKVRCT